MPQSESETLSAVHQAKFRAGAERAGAERAGERAELRAKAFLKYS